MSPRREQLLRYLQENFSALEKALERLMWSWEKCRDLDLETDLTNSKLESLEALASRFARTLDIYTQKVVPNLISLLGEEGPTFLDRANLLEKIGVVDSAERLVELRGLRNAIAHEYREKDFPRFYRNIVEGVLPLQRIIEDTKGFAEEKLK